MGLTRDRHDMQVKIQSEEKQKKKQGPAFFKKNLIPDFQVAWNYFGFFG